MTMHNHLAVIIVMLIVVEGGLQLLAIDWLLGCLSIFANDEHGQLHGDKGDAPKDTVGLYFSEVMQLCFLYKK